MKKLLLLLIFVPLIGLGLTEYKKEYYENGQLKEEGNWKDGERDGFQNRYYKNGQLESEGNFKDGELINEKHWNENGNEIE